jgi:membrane protein
MDLNALKYLVTQSFKQWREVNASRLSAALAYYTIFSIPPLLIIAIAIAAQLFDRAAVQQQVVNQIGGLVGEAGAEVVESILENSREPGETAVAAIISVITLLLGASGVFGELQNALNTIWDVKAKPGRGIWGTIKDRFFSFTMVLGVGFLLLVSLIISAALTAVNEFISGVLPDLVILAQVVNFLVSFGVITVLFGLIFKVVPDVKIAWRDVWVGALVTAFLFTVGKFAIGLYLGNSAPGSTYGAAGSLIVLLLWVYYSAQILFLGAEFTQVYANKYGSRIVADENAVPISPEAQPALAEPGDQQP